MIYTDNSDATVKRIASAVGYTGRKIVILPWTGAVNTDSYWSEGSRNQFHLVSLAEPESIVTLPSNHPIFDPQRKNMLTADARGIVLVEHVIFCGKDQGLRIYVHPEDLNAKLLPAPAELDDAERRVLYVARAYKSSYAGDNQVRQKNSGLTLDEYNLAKSRLIERKLLNKAGAITNAGKNAIVGWRIP